MTEQEWLTGTDPAVMLPVVRGKVSYRKLRLFACACCRRFWDATEQAARGQVELTERYVDRSVDEAIFRWPHSLSCGRRGAIHR